jgi:hypothetical protein
MGQSMSDVSQFNDSFPSRELRGEEHELIRSLLSGLCATASLENMLTTSRVTDMRDGGMGSIRFVGSEPPLGKTLVEAQYLDSDGVLVGIVINTDRNGQLFEVDFWKVDFSPLRRYPRPSDLSARH